MNLDSNTLYVFFIFGMFIFLFVVTFEDDCPNDSCNRAKYKNKKINRDNTKYVYIVNNDNKVHMNRRSRKDDYLEYDEMEDIEFNSHFNSNQIQHDHYRLYNQTFIDDLEPATM